MKRWLNLSIVLAIMFAAGLLMALDYDSTTDKWMALIAAAILFAVGIRLGFVFHRRNMLPE